MSGGWIKWEKDIETDPRFVRLVRSVRNGCVTGALHPATLVVGALVRMWSYADTHVRSDNTLDLGPADIDDLVGIPGFAAALPEDWLRKVDDSTVELPAYQEHNGVEAKKRDLAAKRMERKRLRDRHAGVTQERNGGVTGASLDQTRPDQTKEREAVNGKGPPEAAPKKPKEPRGTRIPDDFIPDRDFALKELPDLDVEAESAKFVDYWRAKPGAEALKLDWPATWRSWIRRNKENGKYPKRPADPAKTAGDLSKAQWR